jgi:choline dehydrogenase-like flavoprotein
MEMNEYIVVGSGCTGAIAAKTLIEKGCKVTLLDVGHLSNGSLSDQNQGFIEKRETDSTQQDFFLGKQFESMANLNQANPSHLTPQRTFISELIDQYLVWDAGDFHPIESLAKGGLGNAWGLGSYVYSPAELEKTGLDVTAIQHAYKWLSNVVSISGGLDVAEQYSTGKLFQPESPIPLDYNGARLWKNLQSKTNSLSKIGFTIGRAPLAISTEKPKNGTIYETSDLDFYSTGVTSAFRPINLIETLEKTGNLSYIPQQLVLRFEEKEDYIVVYTLNTKTRIHEQFQCKKLLLAAGALSTARITMRSTGITKLPVICNPYSFIPSVQIGLLGAANCGYQTGLAQFALYYDPDRKHENVAMGSLYSYRSLMGFRLTREFPLGFKSGQEFLKLLMPALNITGVFHPETSSVNKYIELVKDESQITGDLMRGTYLQTDEELKQIKSTEKAFKTALRKLGSQPIKVKQNRPGASIHYGGTLPFDANGQGESTHPSGKLNGFNKVYIADGSGFRFLSGKGLTLTLMANAHKVANYATED